MKRGSLKPTKQGRIDSCKGKPKILGISSSNRNVKSCAREDATSLFLLKRALKEAEKAGAEVKLIDLKFLNIGPCKECYSSCPAQCRFKEKTNQCDCYPRKEKTFFYKDRELNVEEAFKQIPKEKLLQAFKEENYDERDDMHVVYKAMREADGIIFAGFTNYYGRPALMQLMFSRLCALDGGVEELWGDGKNLKNSIKYAKNSKNKYKQRLFGKFAGFINVSKEGDSVTPNLMKACVMMGMKIIPFATAYNVNWYKDATHRSDQPKTLKDPYTLSLCSFLANEMVKEIKKSDRKYGIYSGVV